MFLDVTMRRNPHLIEAAIILHQAGDIPPNTYLVDLDALQENARHLSVTAQRNNLRLYGMTKQHWRNPLLARAMEAGGIQQAVAVDVDEAKILYSYGTKIGHVGHLSHVPDASIAQVLEMSPEVVTVF